MTDKTRAVVCAPGEWTLIATGRVKLSAKLRDLLGVLHINAGTTAPATLPNAGFADYLTVNAGERMELANISDAQSLWAIPRWDIKDPLTIELSSFLDNNSNVSQKIRDACEVYPNPDVWEDAQVGSGDFIIQRGNTAGAGWIEISKSPFTPNSETLLTMKTRLSMPLKLTTMVSMTHRNAGEQIFAQEFVSDDASYGGEPIADPVPVEILNASQTTTTITLNLTTAPSTPFRVGQVVSVYGFDDTRLNVNNAVISATPLPNQVTLVGNDYAFTSTTIGTTLGNSSAFIERIDMLGGARNGVSLVRGNATATNGRFYVRAQGGLARPSGTLAGAHSTTVASDTSTALAGSAPYSESWGAPNENVLMLSRDGVVYGERAVDAGAGFTSRFRQSQVVPNPERPYLIRFRSKTTRSLTRPVAKIVSISKAGSTTATITTDVPHGLVTGNYVGFYGVNNQTNFANHTTGVICTVIDPVTFSVVHGTSATATSYGGFVMRVQGQQALGGAIAQVAQSVSRTGNIVALVGNTTWAAPTSVGNIVELIGVRDIATGADLGLDGSYVVCNIATSTLTLQPVDGIGPTGADIVSTNCGGGVVQRFGARIHGIVATDYDPFLIEPATKGLTDPSEAQTVNGTVSATQSGTWNIGTLTGGSIAEGTANTASPVTIGGIIRTAAVNLANGVAARLGFSAAGGAIMALGAPTIGAEVASAARTANGNSGTISTPLGGSFSGSINVTAVAGTTPTLDLVLTESLDNGTTWVQRWQAERITGVTTVEVPAMKLTGLRRWEWVGSGTGWSFTFAINTNQLTSDAPYVRSRIDRAISPNTLNWASLALNVDGCAMITMTVVSGAGATTAPVYGIAISPDGTNWADTGVSVSVPASTTQTVSVSGVAAKFARMFIKTAGVAATQTYAEMKAIG